jgi:hypothetical protein
MTIPVLTCCTLGYEVVGLLDSTGVYQKLVPYIPAFSLSFYFISLASIMGRGMDLAGITKWLFLVPFTGIIVSLAIYQTMLPEYGVWAILLSVVLGSFSRNLLNIILAVYFFPRKLHLKKLIFAWSLALIFYGGLSNIVSENLWYSGSIKVILILLLAALQIKLVLFENIVNILEPVQPKKDAI